MHLHASKDSLHSIACARLAGFHFSFAALGMQTWADWKNIPLFYFMYVWLVGMLVDTLSPTERPHSITFSMAWHQILSVALLGVALFLTTVVRLVWLVLVYCCLGNMLVSHTVLCMHCVWYLDLG